MSRLSLFGNLEVCHISCHEWSVMTHLSPWSSWQGAAIRGDK